MALTHLGKTSPLPASPDEAVLDYVPNPKPGVLYLVRFAAPEFTSLCPVTGQPDFAHLVIDYAPDATIVESKSLKLFLASFRNHAGFHEDVTVGIGQRLAEEMKPQLAPHRRLLVSARRHPDRRLLAKRRAARRSVAARSGCAAISGQRLKIVVHGAGSIGCYVGGAWLDAGLDVSFLGRARIGEELAMTGLTLSDTDGWKATVPPERIRFATDPAALAEADIIALCVKSIGTEAAAAEIAAHARPGAIVLSIQNGISNAETLRRLLPGQKVVQGMVPYNVVHLGPGHWRRATWGDLTAEDTPEMRALSQAIGDRPGRLRLTEDIEGIAWGKLAYNVNNAINALSGLTILEELKQRGYRRVFAAAIAEMTGLLRLAGITPARIGAIGPDKLPGVLRLPDFLFRNIALRKWKIDPKGRGSMADDFDARRKTEIDYLNGEVVRLAERLGRTAPVNAAIVALVKDAEAGGRRQWGARDLQERVLG